jgi:hypothetical protein
MRKYIGLWAILTLSAGPTLAEDKITTSLIPAKAGAAVPNAVSFDYVDCEEECHVATLTCVENANIELELADVVTGAVVKAMQMDTKQIVLKAGVRVYDFHIQQLQFAEMTGAWWIDAPLFEEAGPPLVDSLQKVKSFTVSVTSETRNFPVDDKVRTWAKACK